MRAALQSGGIVKTTIKICTLILFSQGCAYNKICRRKKMKTQRTIPNDSNRDEEEREGTISPGNFGQRTGNDPWPVETWTSSFTTYNVGGRRSVVRKHIRNSNKICKCRQSRKNQIHCIIKFFFLSHFRCEPFTFNVLMRGRAKKPLLIVCEKK